MCAYSKKLAKKEAWDLEKGLQHEFNFIVNIYVQKHESFVCSTQSAAFHCGSIDG